MVKIKLWDDSCFYPRKIRRGDVLEEYIWKNRGSTSSPIIPSYDRSLAPSFSCVIDCLPAYCLFTASPVENRSAQVLCRYLDQ